MNRSFQRLTQGVRSDRFSGSKRTNLAPFDPWHSAVDRAYWRYALQLLVPPARPLVVVEPTHPDFVRPLEKADILSVFDRVPSHFVAGLRAILLLRGSVKQARVASRLYCYATYREGFIFLAPYPKRLMRYRLEEGRSPTVAREYQRAGAKVSLHRGVAEVEFSQESLRRYYERDVLLHEIGHHVDRCRRRSRRQQEGFANWFASEYGYRLGKDI